MEKLKRKNSALGRLYGLCPVRHGLLLFSLLLIAAHLLTRRNLTLNRRLSEDFVRPVHRALSRATALLPFSVAELLILLAALGLLTFLAVTIVQGIRRRDWGRRVYITLVTLLSAVAFIYAGFCLLWGVYYYGDDFSEKSGLKAEAVSVEDLRAVTAWFADRCNEYATQVPRDEAGVYAGDRRQILDQSSEVYGRLEQAYPCLAGPSIKAKGVYCSHWLSYFDFTGFFFPFTAEANVNMDFPPNLLPSTVAHELAHQRGVAKEQEANFVAVLACFSYGETEYCYSGALLAYIHLSNALYGVDREAWQEISQSLRTEIRQDLRANRAYWQQFETPVQTVSNTVYEGFLHSYDQQLGLRSYGACVDLLVNYYRDAATEGQHPAG